MASDLVRILSSATAGAVFALHSLSAFAMPVRYVATNGSDSDNDGLSSAKPFATVAHAVTSLGATGGRVYVAAGTYTMATGVPTIVIDTPVEVVGATGKPEDVIIQRPSTSWGTWPGRLFKLDNASARLSALTLLRGKVLKEKDDKEYCSGGNVWITANGGTVEDCILKDGNTETCYGAGGGNVFMKGGRLSRCKLIGGKNNTNAQNEWVYSGGSLVAMGGVIENCTITGCSSGAVPVGLYYGGKMVNCTIAGNSGGASSAIVVGATGGTGDLPSIVNCALFNNGSNSVVRGSVLNKNVTDVEYAKTAFSACASVEAINDDCLAVADPGFADGATGDYRLTASSPLVDVGGTYKDTAATGAFDLALTDRISGTGVDIGAYEYCSPANVRIASVTAAVESGKAVCRVALTSDSIPAEATVSVFRDGQVVDVRRGDLAKGGTFAVSAATPGAYAFKAVVKGKKGNTRIRWTNVYLAGSSAAERFVSPYGNDANTGTSSDVALKTIAQAVTSLGASGGTIYLEPGTYAESGYGTQTFTNAVYLSAPVKIVALAGNPDETVLTRASTCHRVLRLNHAEAAVRCVTIKGGVVGNLDIALAHGGNVWITATGGTVENCVISDGKTTNWAAAGGNVMMSGGRLVGCTLIGGTVKPTTFIGGNNIWCYNGSSIYATGGVIENCIVRDCTSGSGPVALYGSVAMINSTVVNNTGVMCGGIAVGGTGAQVVNCAIFGGQVTRVDALETDVAFASISRSGNASANPSDSFTKCAAAVTINETCVRAAEPKFADPDNDDFTPKADSALVDAGKSGEATAAYDVYGLERVFGAAIDIGAAEYPFGLAPRFGEHEVTVVDDAVHVDVSLLKASAVVDLKLRVYRDGVVLEEKPMGVGYETALHLVYDEPGYYAVKYGAYGENGAVFSGVVGDAYLAGSAANVRIVTPTGAMTLQEAIDDLGSAGGKVYVDPGTYAGTTPVNAFAISNAVTVIGRTTDPRQVKFVKVLGTNARVICLDHAQAALRNVWVSGGYIYTDGGKSPAGDSGGGVLITTKGGTVENCVISGGVTLVYAGGGGNLCMNAGRVAGCLIEGGCSSNDGDAAWSNSGGSVCLLGGVMENCVIREAVGRMESNVRKRLGGAPIVVYNTAKMINCTVADCMGWQAGAVLVRKNVTTIPSVVNCAFYNNVALVDGAADYQMVFKESTFKNTGGATTYEEAQSAFVNCAATHQINDTCLAPASFGFADAANGDYSLAASSPLVNAGADYTAKGGISAFDIAGATRIARGRVDIGAYEYPKVKLTPRGQGLLVIVR